MLVQFPAVSYKHVANPLCTEDSCFSLLPKRPQPRRAMSCKPQAWLRVSQMNSLEMGCATKGVFPQNTGHKLRDSFRT